MIYSCDKIQHIRKLATLTKSLVLEALGCSLSKILASKSNNWNFCHYEYSMIFQIYDFFLIMLYDIALKNVSFVFWSTSGIKDQRMKSNTFIVKTKTLFFLHL